jgi:hypothetical protein
MHEKVEVYAVVRIDEYAKGDDGVRIKEILPTLDEEIQEVERLNELNRDKQCHYFWQTTRYFPNGRS